MDRKEIIECHLPLSVIADSLPLERESAASMDTWLCLVA
jgi:hypothetical protein